MLSFKGKQYFKETILMAVRWYLAYALSYLDIEELLLERGLKTDHSTINRLVMYTPQLSEQFKTKKKIVNGSWGMDETYIKVKGKWMYQFRAVDSEGNTLDSFFSEKRDEKAATDFFIKSIRSSGKPKKINIDKSVSNTSALKTINKYLNNLIEQDHRFIKKITRPTLGFKAVYSARATLEGIELHHMLRKGQMKNSENMNIIEQFFALAA